MPKFALSTPLGFSQRRFLFRLKIKDLRLKRGVRSKITNTKLQIPNNIKIPNLKSKTRSSAGVYPPLREKLVV